MVSQSRITQVLLAPLTFWAVLLGVGSYFIFSFDFKGFVDQTKDLSFYQKITQSSKYLSLTRIKKGIDLAGGTYLVLGVDVQAAIDSRLKQEERSLVDFFKLKKLHEMPSSQVVKNGFITLSFNNQEAAKECAALIQESKGQSLRARQTGNDAVVSLAPEVTTLLKTGVVDQAVSVLNNRLGNYGVEGIAVQKHGDKQIVVQIPGVSDPERIKSLISQTAHLEFKVVEAEASNQDSLLDRFDGELPSEKMIVPGRNNEETSGRYYLVSAYPDMTGDRIVDSKLVFDQYNKPQTQFRLDGQGAGEFKDLTGNNVNKRLGIIIDNVMYSSPSINSEIAGGECVITGIASAKEASDLAVVLKSGSLQAPIKFEQESRVGASLGQDAINAGILSCLVALLILFIFSLIYYKIPGLFAVLALLYNLFLTLIFLSYFGATLTLPGIAGMVVTIGMAIDASILIYEKIKEELKSGVTLRAAINNGFQDAMVVIIDSNITTLITGIVLYVYGGPAIKGFAVTLIAGIIATVLAGVYFLRAMFNFVLDAFKLSSLKF